MKSNKIVYKKNANTIKQELEFTFKKKASNVLVVGIFNPRQLGQH